MAFRIIRVSSRAKLETQLNYLVCRTDTETRVLLDEISVLIIENPQVCITNALISELMNHKIRVIFCDPKHNPQGELEPYGCCFDSSSKLMKQLNWSSEIMDEVWKTIIKNKIRNQRRCMKIHNVKDERINLVHEYEDNVLTGDKTNREGQAAKVYFNSIFGEDFNRNDDFDKNNTFLNYGYSLLLSLVNREISIYGYSNLLGIHHKGPNNPFNLGCDFVEPFRPLIDDYVLTHNLDRENFKKVMPQALTEECRCGQRKMIIQNAVNSYVLSVIAALNEGDTSKILEISFSDGRVNI